MRKLRSLIPPLSTRFLSSHFRSCPDCTSVSPLCFPPVDPPPTLGCLHGNRMACHGQQDSWKLLSQQVAYTLGEPLSTSQTVVTTPTTTEFGPGLGPSSLWIASDRQNPPPPVLWLTLDRPKYQLPSFSIRPGRTSRIQGHCLFPSAGSPFVTFYTCHHVNRFAMPWKCSHTVLSLTAFLFLPVTLALIILILCGEPKPSGHWK